MNHSGTFMPDTYPIGCNDIPSLLLATVPPDKNVNQPVIYYNH